MKTKKNKPEKNREDSAIDAFVVAIHYASVCGFDETLSRLVENANEKSSRFGIRVSTESK